MRKRGDAVWRHTVSRRIGGLGPLRGDAVWRHTTSRRIGGLGPLRGDAVWRHTVSKRSDRNLSRELRYPSLKNDSAFLHRSEYVAAAGQMPESSRTSATRATENVTIAGSHSCPRSGTGAM